jgi:hypothetical protein
VPIVQKSEESARYRYPMSSMEWWEAVERIRDGVSALDQEEVQRSMHCITWGIEWVDPVMNRYCMETCPTCQAPCCTGKEVFFNQADLLYLTALNTQIPPGQTRSYPWEACRYLGEKGCILSRFHRPYVCVWFLCDAQMKILSHEPNRFQRRFLETLQKIRAHRLALESLYELNAQGA